MHRKIAAKATGLKLPVLIL